MVQALSLRSLLSVTLFFGLISHGISQKFEVTVTDEGAYQVLVNNQKWLGSGPTFFQAGGAYHSTADQTLKLMFPAGLSHGMDGLGQFRMVNYTYGASTGSSVPIDCYVKTYEDRPYAIFSQVFREGATKTTVGSMNKVLSGFPTFNVGGGEHELGFLLYADLFIGSEQLTINRWKMNMTQIPSGLLAGPLLIFDHQDNVLIISPFSQFMAASLVHDPQANTVNWGLMGSVDDIPAGYQYDTIVFASDRGINKAMEEWGYVMRSYYGRHSGSRDEDLSINYIGYYTDNGAYYYHMTEPQMNYEETILGAYKYAQTQGIPYRYIQYDDWWYPIKGTGYGATVTWDAMPSVFPDGLQYLYNVTQLPVVAHNRYWSSKTTYAKENGGKFNFLMDGENGIPDDQEFWDYLFSSSLPWGMVVYEQDWLNWQIEHIQQLHNDLTLGRRWMLQMGESAQRYGISLQWCMALPRYLLASLEMPSVSQARASIDYHLKPHQWQIGITSLFAQSMGVAPFKDNFWSKSVQPGNKYNKTESCPLLQATVSLLSTGPVGPSDRIGYSDVALIKRLHTADGLLLKPSKPATAIDAQILQRAFGGSIGPEGEVWTTYSDISGVLFGIIFAAELQGTYNIGPSTAGFSNSDRGKFFESVVYSYKYKPGTGALPGFDDSNELTLDGCTYDDFCLYYTSPILEFRGEALVILGEMDKLVPMSPKRVTSLSYSDSDIQLTLKGTPGEAVEFSMQFLGGTLVPISCVISSQGTSVISVADRSCH